MPACVLCVYVFFGVVCVCVWCVWCVKQRLYEHRSSRLLCKAGVNRGWPGAGCRRPGFTTDKHQGWGGKLAQRLVTTGGRPQQDALGTVCVYVRARYVLRCMSHCVQQCVMRCVLHPCARYVQTGAAARARSVQRLRAAGAAGAARSLRGCVPWRLGAPRAVCCVAVSSHSATCALHTAHSTMRSGTPCALASASSPAQ